MDLETAKTLVNALDASSGIVAAVGAGCAGTAGVPVLSASSVPFPGNLAFALQAGPYAAGTNAALLVGFATVDPALQLFNGCPFWLEPALPVFPAARCR